MNSPGDRSRRQFHIPALVGDLTYIYVAAEDRRAVLLRSDGTAVACGHNQLGHDIPALDGDLIYTQVAVGTSHTVLLRNDGTAVAYGQNESGECDAKFRTLSECT